MAAVGRNVAAPLLFLNLAMYLIVIGFASWCLNHFINGQTNHPGIYPSVNSPLPKFSVCDLKYYGFLGQ